MPPNISSDPYISGKELLLQRPLAISMKSPGAFIYFRISREVNYKTDL